MSAPENPQAIVPPTPRFIQSVLEDAQSTIARLTAEKQELVEALELSEQLLIDCGFVSHDVDLVKIRTARLKAGGVS
ncbi:hypothetical protein UFOVP407_33 [uncultured Caudovirales phage]|uniref:Uncharacterized protein n=1 Tax=uncultured Caudovirales phage TaxID=2100421 RepID=A0A6J5M1Q3_9CAUD|nr:hypothetical protein UFOVP407_33 [uncultured Caudovirales phage]